jgi:hypothetical protein
VRTLSAILAAIAAVGLLLLATTSVSATDQPKDRGEASVAVDGCEVVFTFQFAKAKERRFAYVVQPGTDVPEWPRDNPENVITETVTTDATGWYRSDIHVLGSGTWTLVWDNESPIDKSFRTVTFEVDCPEPTEPPTTPPTDPPSDPTPRPTLPPTDTADDVVTMAWDAALVVSVITLVVWFVVFLAILRLRR